MIIILSVERREIINRMIVTSSCVRILRTTIDSSFILDYQLISTRIACRNRIIPAVRKHIVPQEALAGTAVGVGVEEPLDGWVIISGLQVIEARLYEDRVAIEVKKWS